MKSIFIYWSLSIFLRLHNYQKNFSNNINRKLEHKIELRIKFPQDLKKNTLSLIIEYFNLIFIKLECRISV